MDYSRIQIDSIGIGLSNIYNLDLIKDNFIKTYLVVGELFNDSHDIKLDTNNLNHIHNFVVTDKSVGVNTTRNNIISLPNKSLIIDGNIHCRGSITAESIILSEDINISANLSENIKSFNQVLNRISSHLVFYSVKDYLQDNIYTTHNVTIGNINNANNNTNPLKISRHCNNNINNIQFVIQNNDETNGIPSRFSCGIIGNINNSPAHIITSKNMPLHFNISKFNNEIDNLYIKNDTRQATPEYTTTTYPSLSLDTNGSVLVNLDKSKGLLTYDNYIHYYTHVTTTRVSEYPKLYVNGLMYADKIMVRDYITNEDKTLDSLYMRQSNGLTLYANQIRGGNFNKEEFIFNSNVYIGTETNKYKLVIYGNSEITDNLKINNTLTTTDLIINNNLQVNGNGICDFNNNCYFSGSTYFNSLNCGNSITTNTINITDKLFYNGNEIPLNNLIGIGTTTGTTTGTITGTITGTTGLMTNMTITNSINIGGETTNISDTNYNSDIINIYKHRENQKNQFELYLHDSTLTPYGSSAYIGHPKLNTLENEFDNSLVILTQYNTTWNNIYFYAGKNRLKLNDTVPNLAIFENNKIGINTIKPSKTLDINGDIITSNYYIKKNNIEYECDMIMKLNNNNYLSNLNIGYINNGIINEFNNNNKKQLNIKGGLNSYDGYYEGSNKLCMIKYLNSSNAIIENTNIGLGIQINDNKITIPLQIQNTNINNNKINNSVLTFYRSIDNSKYSGIEFCDDATDLNNVNKNKWYIYKTHITDDINYAGPLQFGYISNGYKPNKSCINLYYDNDKYYIDINNPITYTSQSDYNRNKEDIRITGNVRITGDIELDGSINIKGNYKFNDNNILFSPNPVETIINKIYSLGNNVYYFDTIISPNHPKKISYDNSNLSYEAYLNILNDKNNYNRDINIKYSTSNNIYSSNNYSNNEIILNDIISYSNLIINTSNNTNIYKSYINNISTNIQNNYNVNSTLYQTYANNSTSIISVTTLLNNASNNMLYSYSNYKLSSNIYNIIDNLYYKTIIASNTSLNLVNITGNGMITTSNISKIIIDAYKNITYNADVNIINKYGYSNILYSSNVYSNALNYYNKIINISNQIITKNPNNSIISLATTTKELMNNDYNLANNYYKLWNDKKLLITPVDYSDIIYNNKQYSFTINNNLTFIQDNLYTYYQLYNNISNNILLLPSQINISKNLLQSNINNNNEIYQLLSLPIKSYYDSALINSNISYSNYIITSNIKKDNNIENINYLITNSNVIDKFSNISYKLKLELNENNIKNHNFYSDHYMNTNIIPTVQLENNRSSNNIYSLNTYNISSNIHINISNINNFIGNYIIVANNYKEISINNLIKTSDNYNNLLKLYDKLDYIADINNIIITGTSNNILASNIYISSSNYYNNLSNIKILTSNLSLISSNDMTYSSNNYIKCKYLQEHPQDFSLYSILSNNSNYSTSMYLNITNIYDNILDNYPSLYPTLLTSVVYDNICITNSNVSFDNILLTDRIVNAINTNIDSYVEKSYNNSSNAIKLDIDISSFDPDYSSNLIYYSNDIEITNGIYNLKNYIEILKNKLITFGNNITNLYDSYKYIFSGNLILKNSYDEIINKNNYNINLLLELIADIIYISEYSISAKEKLLELTLHITNKYINFINNSYDFANLLTSFVTELSNYIGIHVNSSLSLIPLLNNMIEYANNQLYLSWYDISQNIVLFASLSYSINSQIKTITPITKEGQNTDVLIIGNNIKLYPNKSLIIGNDNQYLKWLETINDNANDNDNNSSTFLYNSNPNSLACSFNCYCPNFSSVGGITTFKSSASIDLNLIDTLISSPLSFEDTVVDGILFKISHIYHRTNTTNSIPTSQNSIFEITRKKTLNSPYFSFYTTSDNKNILNIGDGNFYDENNNCISEDTVVHINQNTSTNLLKLTNTSTNPINIGFKQNNINNWLISVANNFSFNNNSLNIFNITSSGVAINSTLTNSSMFINSFNNKPALELKNNYITSEQLLETRIIQITDKLKVIYDETGITYSKNNDINDDYDISKTNFNYMSNISLDDIRYTLSNVNVNYNNISLNNPFTFTLNNNVVNLMPILQYNDINITHNYDLNVNYNRYSSTHTSFGNLQPIIINYDKPINATINTTRTIVQGDSPDILRLETTINHTSTYQSSDIDTILIIYIINALTVTDNQSVIINVSNLINYNKYASLTLPLLNIKLSNYKYNLVRLNNVVPSSLYNNNLKNIITKTQTNNYITIDNIIDYLKSFPIITSNLNTYTENKLKLYPIKINNNIYNIPINITINDKYYKYENNNINLPIEYVNTSVKLPLIKQTNIYNNTHNIYSFTDDYEIYLNNTKLININSRGTLKTTGNIETNNIYLKGDIYNSDGISLYDNILSLINNISSTTNFELNTRNIILNPAIGFRDTYKGGILINGNNINPRNNNLFQINNFSDNDNFLTLNSCTANSFIHFNNKITKIVDYDNRNFNSIYKVGLTNETFGIWKYDLTSYDPNLFIDTNITTNNKNALLINYQPSTNNFQLVVNGPVSTNSDSRLKTDIRVIDNALNKLCQLEGITYENIGSIGAPKRQTGLLAQDVMAILPEAVIENKEGYYSIAYGNLAGLIVEAIKELKTDINIIKTKLNII